MLSFIVSFIISSAVYALWNIFLMNLGLIYKDKKKSKYVAKFPFTYLFGLVVMIFAVNNSIFSL